MNFKKILLVLLCITIGYSSASADEGLWLPMNISQKIDEMKAKGLKLSDKDIYDINQVCLKDAVVGLTTTDFKFNSFCTASFVSKEGLLLTNYHCILNYIQQISSEKNDFIKYGLWTTKREEEPSCFSLQANRLVKMVDVTAEIIDGMTAEDAQNIEGFLSKKGRIIVNRETEGTHYEGNITALHANNQFILSIYEIFTDVRLVAAPPMQIGKYGSEEDNWMWPRYTGDFAFIRVYANKDNKPAKYAAADNVPYQPVKYFPISLKGVKEDDFVMIFGYPGSTRAHIPSFALEEILNGELTSKVRMREEKLALISALLKKDEAKKLRYTTRFNSLQNSYLRWKGEKEGIINMNLVEKKKDEEKIFINWVDQTPERKAKYAGVLDSIADVYKDLSQYNLANTYFEETALFGADVIPFAGKFEKLMVMFNKKKLNTKAVNGETSKLIPLTKQFFEYWDKETDRLTYRAMLMEYYEHMPANLQPKEMTDALLKYDGDVDKFLQEAYKTSVLTDGDRLVKMLENAETNGVDELKNDPLYQTSLGFYRINVNQINPGRKKLQNRLLVHFRVYMQGLLEMSNNDILPDANRTMRVSYGQVKPVVSLQKETLPTFTYLDGMMSKVGSSDPVSTYYVPKKLRNLYDKKDFGKYSIDNKIPVNFISNTQTSSGNSGSPVLNANGQLIGLNFDRFMDGVASDYRYIPELSRNISVDIRYILFIMDKYSASQQVLDELQVVE